MGYAILGTVAVVFGIGWIKYKLAAQVLCYYMQKKQLDYPTDDELKECTEFIIRNTLKDIFR